MRRSQTPGTIVDALVTDLRRGVDMRLMVDHDHDVMTDPDLTARHPAHWTRRYETGRRDPAP